MGAEYCTGLGSGRGAGGEAGNAGATMRDPRCRRIKGVDAGLLVTAERRIGRVEYMGCRMPWPLQKLDHSWRPFHTSSSIPARLRNLSRAGASARAEGGLLQLRA